MSKIKKRILAMLLTVSLVCGNELMIFAETNSGSSNVIETVAEATVVKSGSCGRNVTYTYYSDGELVISGNGEVNGYSTTSMPWYSYRSSMKKLTIEEGITKLGYQSFINCTGLTMVSFPTTLQTTDQSTFSGCTNISNIYIKDLLSYMKIDWASNAEPKVKNGNLYLNGNLVTDLTIPSEITNLSDTFMNFTSLKRVTIPSTVSTISYYAFYGCKNLENVTIASGVTSISPYAFQGCTSLKSIEIPDSVASVEDSAFADCTSLTSVKLSAGMTTIKNSVFNGCTSLKSIEIPGYITTIGYSAFAFCSSLEEVVLNSGTTTIDSYAFQCCSKLEKITIPDTVTTINNRVFDGCDALKDVYFAGSQDTWDAIAIGNYNDPLINANIHCVEKTGSCGAYLTWTFYSDGLLKITGTGSMKNYNSGYDSPFYEFKDRINCVELPDGITTIGEYAFQLNYPKLVSVKIPLSISHIQDYSFDTSIKLIYPGTMAQWDGIYVGEFFYDMQYGAECSDGTILYMGRCGKNAEFKVYGDGTLNIIGTGSVEFYKWLQPHDSYWDRDVRIRKVEISEGINSIASYAFEKCENLESIYIPFSMKYISEYVFNDCSNLKDVYYVGCKAKWDKVSIGSNNDPVFDATIHYSYLCGEGHTWLDATCTVPMTCSVCEEISGETLLHKFEQEKVDEKYEVSKATCKAKAVYKKSCICGEVGEETFEYGSFDASNHVGGTTIENAKEASCKEPGYSGDEICLGCQNVVKAGEEIPQKIHEYNQSIVDEKYEVSKATCKSKAVYKKSCICGEAGGETFEYGSFDA